MRILMINKFLHPNGGSETYIFKLGKHLKALGHEVEYFGMEHDGRIVGNRINSYTSNMDFHGGSKLSKLIYPVKTIYSSEARKKLRRVLEDFRPEVCHLNNFNYQLTPSIILEIRKWEKQTGNNVRIVYTAHDYQLVCPNHMLHNPNTHTNCERCLGGQFGHCVKGKCIHGSRARSLIGTAEALFWKWRGVYRQLDAIICPSYFMKEKLDSNPIFRNRTVVMWNFIEPVEARTVKKQDYVLYFGRYSEEKGIKTLLSVCEELPEIPFVFAGSGPLEQQVANVKNIKNVGFQTGEALEQLIRQARFTVYPSEWYENCPFSVMESQLYQTPVIGAAIGGIPELIEEGISGRLFESGNKLVLKKLVAELWENPSLVKNYEEGCRKIQRDDINAYCKKLLQLYKQCEK